LEKYYNNTPHTFDILNNREYAHIRWFNEAIETKKKNWNKYVKVYSSYFEKDAPTDDEDFNNSINDVILVWNWMKELVLQSWFLGSLIDQALIDVEITVDPQVIRTWWK
jgi:Mn-containing catalase